MTDTDLPASAEQIHGYIADNFLYMRPDLEIEPDTPLLETDVLDSMGVVELVGFLEEEFGIDVGNDEINEENFESVRSLTEYVEGKKNGGSPADA